jgi:hypothetical protein
MKPQVDASQVYSALGRQLPADPHWLDRVGLQYRRLPRFLCTADTFAQLAEHELLRRVVMPGRVCLCHFEEAGELGGDRNQAGLGMAIARADQQRIRGEGKAS